MLYYYFDKYFEALMFKTDPTKTPGSETRDLSITFPLRVSFCTVQGLDPYTPSPFTASQSPISLIIFSESREYI